MSLPKRYNPKTAELDLLANWQEQQIYAYDPNASSLRFSVDTPPATVSGKLHLGHVYSYSHTDFIVRYQRMKGHQVFYPMGFDDNGLPTERLVERLEGVWAQDVGRSQFIERCLAVSEEAEKEYRALWQRLGLSIDWRYSYRTIDTRSRTLAQWSFLDLMRKELVYRQQAPAIWCPECQTAIAQAELNDLERDSTFYTLDFRLSNGESLPIATTRPELLSACVAVFVHPEDSRYQSFIGQQVTIPFFDRTVPLLADAAADPEKGTGAVMCCTFGDTADVIWWRTYDLPLIEVIGKNGRLTEDAHPFTNLTIMEGRQAIVQVLRENDQLLAATPLSQSVRVHERCDTPVEYVVAQQWFVRVLDFKEKFLELGAQIQWHPPSMHTRYQQWVSNLGWDWCVSRQRFFGVPIPVWTCADCGHVYLPNETELPVNPLAEAPATVCPTCQGSNFQPETDVFDTWFTSSLTPQIAGGFQADDDRFEQIFPFSMRPQAHEIIRTWAFYTIVKSYHHFGKLPFDHVAISGWGLAPEGSEKLSKSRGGSGIGPMKMIDKYSADAVRYWAASTAIGKDAIINEEKIEAGSKLATKLWNVARFSQRFLAGYQPEDMQGSFTLADRWLLAQTHQLIKRATDHFEKFDYASAKSETEQFFWHILADNYLEMAKMRLYAGGSHAQGAVYTLYHALLTTLKLLAPILPFVTECIYEGMFAEAESDSIHQTSWPTAPESWFEPSMIADGEHLVEIATAVRRFKSQHNMSLGAELAAIYVCVPDETLSARLLTADQDLRSITRANEIFIGTEFNKNELPFKKVGDFELAIIMIN
jgi:valyl-tRNA synthetase